MLKWSPFLLGIRTLFLAHLLDLRISYLKCNLPKYLVTSIQGISIDDFWYKNIFLLPISLLHLTFQRKIMFQAAVITFYFRYDKEIRQIDSAEKKNTKNNNQGYSISKIAGRIGTVWFSANGTNGFQGD